MLLTLHVALSYWRLRWLLLSVEPVTQLSWKLLAAEIAQELNLHRSVRLLLSERISSPVTLGVIKPRVLLPPQARQWDMATLRSVLAHEIAHIKRLDWLTLTLAHLACILFWWLPGVWTLKKQLHIDSELAADNLVLQLGIKPSAYAEQLLGLARQLEHQHGAVVALARRGEIYNRITALLELTTNRDPVKRSALAALMLATGVSTAVVAALEATTISSTAPALQRWLHQSFEPVKIRLVDPEPRPEPAQSSWDYRQLKALATELERAPGLLQDRMPIESILVTASAPKFSSAGIVPRLETEDLDLAQVEVEGMIPLNSVAPNYPLRARHKGIEGYVVVRFDLGTSGKPENIRVLESEPPRVFDEAVQQALVQSSYRPYAVAGQPVRVEGIVNRYRFQLAADKARNVVPEQKKPSTPTTPPKLDSS